MKKTDFFQKNPQPMHNTAKRYLKDFQESKEKPYVFHFAHFLNIRNLQIGHLNALSALQLIRVQREGKKMCYVYLTEEGKQHK